MTPFGLVLRRTRRLRQPDALLRAVVEDDVGERTADIDAEPIAHAVSFARTVWRYFSTRRSHDPGMALEALDAGLTSGELGDHRARRLVVHSWYVTVFRYLPPRARRCSAPRRRREHVVRADRLVAVGDARPLAEEQRAVVAHALEDQRGSAVSTSTCSKANASASGERLVVRSTTTTWPWSPQAGPARSAVGRLVELRVDLAHRLLGERAATS